MGTLLRNCANKPCTELGGSSLDSIELGLAKKSPFVLIVSNSTIPKCKGNSHPQAAIFIFCFIKED